MRSDSISNKAWAYAADNSHAVEDNEKIEGFSVRKADNRPCKGSEVEVCEIIAPEHLLIVSISSLPIQLLLTKNIPAANNV